MRRNNSTPHAVCNNMGPVAQAMDWADPPAAAVEFQRRELIHRRESR
jgi:hypothetical protein